MKTDELVSLLAAGAEPVPVNAVGRRFAVALGWSVPVAALVMAVTFGIRHDLAQAMMGWLFWMKLVFAGSLALAGFVATERLGRPGMRLAGIWMALAAPVLLLWLAAAAVLFDAEPTQRADLILGTTWKTCPFNIALISLPLLAATLWTMKGLAPTRLTLAGAGAGLLAGALSALVYALHCPESTVPFIGIWYVLGIAMPTLAGALLGPRVLRW